MREADYNAADPRFLLSRALDENLAEDDQRRLDRALARSRELRVEAQELRALDGLIKRWAQRPVELDWEHHAALIKARTESDDETAQFGKLDNLLERWGSVSIPLDGDAFTARVMAEVLAERSRAPRSGMLVRLGVPLVAAAAIVLAVTATYWMALSRKPVAYVTYEPWASTTRAMARRPDAAGQSNEIGSAPVVVSFARNPLEGDTRVWSPPRISFGAVGSSAPVEWPEETPPL